MNKLKEINGKFYQEAEVVMLATDNKTSVINLENDDELLHINQYVPKLEYGNQHLYFLSNEEIKEGDWCYHPEVSQEYSTVTKEGTKTGLHPTQGVFQWKSTTNPWYKKAKKIIATTNNKISINLGLEKWVAPTNSNYDLIYTRLCPFPQPSQSFIQAFIKAYNEGKPITKVLVEMRSFDTLEYNSNEFKKAWENNKDYILKINSSNEITIKKVKDSWTREEIGQILADFLTDCWNKDYQFNGLAHDEVANKWIEKYL